MLSDLFVLSLYLFFNGIYTYGALTSLFAIVKDALMLIYWTLGHSPIFVIVDVVGVSLVFRCRFFKQKLKRYFSSVCVWLLFFFF